MTTPTRTEFEAAAYRWWRERWCDDGDDAGLEIVMHVRDEAEFDACFAAAMGWPTVPEVRS